MQEFRPASVIADDTRLASLIAAGDHDALAAFVQRYAGPVTGLATGLTGDIDVARRVAREVFVEAARRSGDLEAGSDFAPWLADIACRLAADAGPIAAGEATPDSVDRLWAVTSATSGLPPHRHDTTRAFYVDGTDSGADPDAAADGARDRLRLERRLAHLSDAEVAVALRDERSWVLPEPDLADRVLAAALPSTSTPHASPNADADESSPDDPRRSTRSVRPVLLGFGLAFAGLFGVIAVLSAFSGAPKQAAFTADLNSTGLVAEVVGGEITVTERDAGIEIALDAASLPRRAGGDHYEGLLVLDSGETISVGTFSEGVDVTLWGGGSLDRVTAFRIVLASVAAGPDPASVVLKADVPLP